MKRKIRQPRMRWLNLPLDGDVGAQCHCCQVKAASCSCRWSPHSNISRCLSFEEISCRIEQIRPRTKLFFGFLFQCVSDFNLPNNNFPSLVFSLSWLSHVRKSKRNNRKKKSPIKLFERRQAAIIVQLATHISSVAKWPTSVEPRDFGTQKQKKTNNRTELVCSSFSG